MRNLYAGHQATVRTGHGTPDWFQIGKGVHQDCAQGKDIVIDCTELEYIASSGLRILLSILKKAKASGGRVILKNPNDIIKDVLEMTGFVKIFDFE